MSVFLFVIDGLGLWNHDKESTFNILKRRVNINSDMFPFLNRIGLNDAIVGKGNLLIPKSNIAGSLEGHREMMGYISTNLYDVCQDGLPNKIIERVYRKTNIKCLGNIQGRGENVVPLYSRKMEEPRIIIYSGYDSTVSIAFREDDFSIEEIKKYAETLMNELIENHINIRKIIIRQYDYQFEKIKFRKEVFSKIEFDKKIRNLKFPKVIINRKIQDILDLSFADVKECNSDKECIEFLYKEKEEGFFFFNFPDFDTYAHQANLDMCVRTLKQFDIFLEKFWESIAEEDYIIVTSDHGVQIQKSDLSNMHVLENVGLFCLDKNGFYCYNGAKEGLDQIYSIVKDIQDGRKMSCSFQRMKDNTY